MFMNRKRHWVVICEFKETVSWHLWTDSIEILGQSKFHQWKIHLLTKLSLLLLLVKILPFIPWSTMQDCMLSMKIILLKPEAYRKEKDWDINADFLFIKDRTVILDSCRNVGFVGKTVDQPSDETTSSHVHEAGIIQLFPIILNDFSRCPGLCPKIVGWTPGLQEQYLLLHLFPPFALVFGNTGWRRHVLFVFDAIF